LKNYLKLEGLKNLATMKSMDIGGPHSIMKNAHTAFYLLLKQTHRVL